MIRIGIDPGITGAVAILKDDYKCGGVELLELFDMPTETVGKRTGRERRRISVPLLREELAKAATLAEQNGYSIIANVESVSAMPGQGVSSTFSLGDSAGVIRAVLACLFIPQRQVTPNEWKRHWRLLHATKDASRSRATEVLPAYASNWSRARDHNRAEAVLIAMYQISWVPYGS